MNLSDILDFKVKKAEFKKYVRFNEKILKISFSEIDHDININDYKNCNFYSENLNSDISITFSEDEKLINILLENTRREQKKKQEDQQIEIISIKQVNNNYDGHGELGGHSDDYYNNNRIFPNSEEYFIDNSDNNYKTCSPNLECLSSDYLFRQNFNISYDNNKQYQDSNQDNLNSCANRNLIEVCNYNHLQIQLEQQQLEGQGPIENIHIQKNMPDNLCPENSENHSQSITKRHLIHKKYLPLNPSKNSIPRQEIVIVSSYKSQKCHASDSNSRLRNELNCTSSLERIKGQNFQNSKSDLSLTNQIHKNLYKINILNEKVNKSNSNTQKFEIDHRNNI